MGCSQTVDTLNVTLREREFTQVQPCPPPLCLTPAHVTLIILTTQMLVLQQGKLRLREVNRLSCSGRDYWMVEHSLNPDLTAANLRVLPLNIHAASRK